MPPLWRPRRILLCSALVAASLFQAVGAIALSAGAAALLRAESHLYGLPVLGIFGISCVVVLGLFVVQQVYAERFALSYVHEVRMAYARQALLVPFDVKSPGIGLSLTRLVNDLGAVKLWLSRGLLALIALVPVIGTLSVWVFVFENDLLLPLATVVLVWCLAVLMTLPGLRHSIRQSRQKRGGISLLLGRALPQRLPLLLHGKAEPVLARLAGRSGELCRYLIRRAIWSGLLKAGCRATFPLAVCVYALATGPDAGKIVLFLMVFSFLATQLEAGAAGIEYYQANRVAREKLARVFALPVLPTARTGSAAKDIWENALSLDRFELPSGATLTGQIESGSCHTFFISAASDRSHLALSLAGLTDARARKRLSVGGVSFDTLSAKEIWQQVTLIAPENGIPEYRAKRPAVELGNRGTPSETLRETLTNSFGTAIGRDAAPAPGLSEDERRGICVVRAFLRNPRVIVVNDCGVSASPAWTGKIRDLAKLTGTTLVFLSEKA